MTNPEFKTGDKIVVINTTLFDRSITVGSLGEIVESKSPFEYGQYIVTIKFDKFEQILSKLTAHKYIKHQELLQGLETYLEREWANYDKVIAQELKKVDVVIAEYRVRRVLHNVHAYYDLLALRNSRFGKLGGKPVYPNYILPQQSSLIDTRDLNHDRT